MCPGRGMPIGDQRQLEWLRWIIAAVLVLNGVDAVLTIAWVHTGWAEEANPLVRHLVENHPVLFVVVKTALVALGSALLWMRRDRPAAVIGIFAVFLVYYAVILHHLRFTGWLLHR